MQNGNKVESPKARPADFRREFIREFIQSRAIATASEGQRIISPRRREQRWLLDLRKATLDGEALAYITELFWERFAERLPFQVGGMEAAAIPLVAAIVLAGRTRGTPVNAFVVRKERKTSGLARLIEGEPTAEPVIVVDDIVNSGASLEKVRAVLADIGRNIAGVFAIVDFRSNRGRKWAAQHGIGVTSLFTIDDFHLPLSTKADSAPTVSFAPAWTFASPNPNHFTVAPRSTPAYDGKRLYVGSDAGVLWAIDAATGAAAWSFAAGDAGRKGIWSSPLLHENFVFFGAYDGCVYCLDRETGKEIWKFAQADWVGSSPVVAPGKGLLFIGLEYALPGGKGGIAALDLATGTLRWEVRCPSYVHGTPIVAPDEEWVACGTNDGHLICLETPSGRELWRYTAGNAFKAAPAFDRARGWLLAGSFDRKVHVVDAKTGQSAWSAATGGAVYTTPLVAGDMAFVGSTDKNLYVLDLAQRSVKRKIPLGGKIFASPRLIGQRLFVGTTGGCVKILDMSSLRVTDSLQLPDRVVNPVVDCAAQGLIVVPTHDNRLFAFRMTETESASSSASKDRPERSGRIGGGSAEIAKPITTVRKQAGEAPPVPIIANLSSAYAEGTYFRIRDPDPEDGHGKPFPVLPGRRMFGAAAMLLMASPAHAGLRISDLERHVLPPLLLDQARVFLYGLRPIGLVTWASLSEKAEARLLAGERLAVEEWRSGGRLWLMDVVAPFGGGDTMVDIVQRHVLGGHRLNLIKLDKEDQRITLIVPSTSETRTHPSNDEFVISSAAKGKT